MLYEQISKITFQVRNVELRSPLFLPSFIGLQSAHTFQCSIDKTPLLLCFLKNIWYYVDRKVLTSKADVLKPSMYGETSPKRTPTGL